MLFEQKRQNHIVVVLTVYVLHCVIFDNEDQEINSIHSFMALIEWSSASRVLHMLWLTMMSNVVIRFMSVICSRYLIVFFLVKLSFLYLSHLKLSYKFYAILALVATTTLLTFGAWWQQATEHACFVSCCMQYCLRPFVSFFPIFILSSRSARVILIVWMIGTLISPNGGGVIVKITIYVFLFFDLDVVCTTYLFSFLSFSSRYFPKR